MLSKIYFFPYFMAKSSVNKVVFQETLKELFPSWEVVKRCREVIIFVAGLMKDPRPLVQHVYEMQVDFYLNELRISGYLSIDTDLLKALHAESTVRLVDHPLHNKYINTTTT